MQVGEALKPGHACRESGAWIAVATRTTTSPGHKQRLLAPRRLGDLSSNATGEIRLITGAPRHVAREELRAVPGWRGFDLERALDVMLLA